MGVKEFVRRNFWKGSAIITAFAGLYAGSPDTVYMKDINNDGIKDVVVETNRGNEFAFIGRMGEEGIVYIPLQEFKEQSLEQFDEKMQKAWKEYNKRNDEHYTNSIRQLNKELSEYQKQKDQYEEQFDRMLEGLK